MNQQLTHRINIAIDGPAGAGKSTVARLVAGRLRYVYVDTGAMYRAVTYAALTRGFTPEDEAGIAAMAGELDIKLSPGEQGQIVLLNGEDVTSAIRTLDVNRNVSQVAAIGAVRLRLADLQRLMATAKGVVMDGRDIGTHVLPDAELKVFLTASSRERAERRYRELDDHSGLSLDQLEQEIAERDRRDREREIAPLLQASDAILLDSTGRTIEQIVDEIVGLAESTSPTIMAREQ